MAEFESKGYFTMEDGQLSCHVIPQNYKFLDHVVVPKGKVSPYNFFLKHNFKELQSKNPDSSMIDKRKASSDLWQKLEPEGRKKFEELSRQDGERYDR